MVVQEEGDEEGETASLRQDCVHRDTTHNKKDVAGQGGCIDSRDQVEREYRYIGRTRVARVAADSSSMPRKIEVLV